MRRLKKLLAEGMLEPRAPGVDDFRNDGNRDLLRQDRRDIQPDRHVNTLETLRRDALGLELFDDRADFALAADHPDVAGICLYGPSQHVLVFLVPARDDD